LQGIKDFVNIKFSIHNVRENDAVFKNVLNFSGVKSIELDLRHTIIDRMHRLWEVLP
jgi:hypothetical protein